MSNLVWFFLRKDFLLYIPGWPGTHNSPPASPSLSAKDRHAQLLCALFASSSRHMLFTAFISLPPSFLEWNVSLSSESVRLCSCVHSATCLCSSYFMPDAEVRHKNTGQSSQLLLPWSTVSPKCLAFKALMTRLNCMSAESSDSDSCNWKIFRKRSCAYWKCIKFSVFLSRQYCTLTMCLVFTVLVQ